MNIAICGITGLIGAAIYDVIKGKHNVIGIYRKDFISNSLEEKLRKADIVINLAGESITKFWKRNYKKRIYNSRIDTTKAIVDNLVSLNKKDVHLVNASAVGIYDSYNEHTEDSVNFDNGYLGYTVQTWENVIKEKNQINTYTICRFGIVLTPEGGFLKSVLSFYRLGIAPNFGQGIHFFPFIHLQDVVNILSLIIEKSITGIINIVTPQTIKYNSFHNELLNKFGKKPIFNVPEWLLKRILGELSDIFLKGQKVIPDKLIQMEYPYLFPDVKSVIAHI